MGALRIERDGDVLRITLARPETRNAFDAALLSALAEAFVDVGKARAVVLSGDGPSFCAGADIEWMRASVDLSYDENVADATALRRMLDAIDTCPAPVIAVVHGHALGGGAGLVAVADIAIAHERTAFGFSEVKLGITPAVISPYVIRKIGESAARRYFVTGERFDAAAALRIGLVHEVTADLDGALERLLGELRTAGPRAARHAKRLVLDRPDGPETARRIAERRSSDEGQEGLRAFLEGRVPGRAGFASWSPPAETEDEPRRLAGGGQSLHDLVRAPHLAEDPGNSGQRRAMMPLGEGGGRVLHDDHVEAAVGGVASRRLDAHVRRHAGHDERVDPHVAEQPLDAGRVEGARRVLYHIKEYLVKLSDEKLNAIIHSAKCLDMKDFSTLTLVKELMKRNPKLIAELPCSGLRSCSSLGSIPVCP